MLLELNAGSSCITPVQRLSCLYLGGICRQQAKRSTAEELLGVQGTVVVADPSRLVNGHNLKGSYLVVLPHSLGMLPLHQCKLIVGLLMEIMNCLPIGELPLRMVLHMCHLLASCAALLFVTHAGLSQQLSAGKCSSPVPA